MFLGLFLLVIFHFLIFYIINDFTPQPENAPTPLEEDTMFLGLEQVSEEELLEIIGSVITGGGYCPAGAEELGPQPHTQWYEKEIRNLAKKIKLTMLSITAAICVGTAGAGYLLGTTISIGTLISLISSNLGSILIPIVGGYIFTEALVDLAQYLGGSENIVTITETLINGISYFLAEQIYNN